MCPRNDVDFFAEPDEALYRWRTEGPYVADRERELFRAMQDDEDTPERVLGVGVGEGADCPFVEEVWAGATWFGVDIFLGNVKSCASKHPAWQVIAADGTHLPFACDTFDTVYLKDVLHHVPDPVAVLQEMWRVCRPGGRLVIAEACARNPICLLLGLTVRHERGLLRNSLGRLRQWFQESTGQSGTWQMLQALPLWRVVFHYKVGVPRLQSSRIVCGTLDGIESVFGVILPRCWRFYAVGKVTKPNGQL